MPGQADLDFACATLYPLKCRMQPDFSPILISTARGNAVLCLEITDEYRSLSERKFTSTIWYFAGFPSRHGRCILMAFIQ